MARYDRTVKAGAADYDPRQYQYAVYKCDDCSEESEFTINPGFQYRDRPCKVCGSMAVGDLAAKLTAERDRLQNEVSSRLSRIAEIDGQLESVATKRAVEEVVQPTEV